MLDQPLILLAEENPQDASLLQLALEQAGVSNPIRVVANCDEVIRYLKGEDPYADRQFNPLPAVILLAARLPLLHGFHTLRWIRNHQEFARIKVGILAGTEYPDESRMAREMGADSYQVKPFDFVGLVSLLAQLRQDWLLSNDGYQAAA